MPTLADAADGVSSSVKHIRQSEYASQAVNQPKAESVARPYATAGM